MNIIVYLPQMSHLAILRKKHATSYVL